MPARRIVKLAWLLAVLVAVGPSGCVGLFKLRPKAKLSPKYRGPEATRLLPVLYAPVIGCPSSLAGIEPDQGARALATDMLVPDLLASLGNRRHPGFAARHAHIDLCQQFFLEGTYPGWSGNAVLRRHAAAALAGSDASAVLFLMVSMQYRCEDLFDEVLAADGFTVIGRIKRGTRCYEDGTVLVIAALVTRAGELAWHSGGKTDDDSLLDFARDYPRAADPAAPAAAPAEPVAASARAPAGAPKTKPGGPSRSKGRPKAPKAAGRD